MMKHNKSIIFRYATAENIYIFYNRVAYFYKKNLPELKLYIVLFLYCYISFTMLE